MGEQKFTHSLVTGHHFLFVSQNFPECILTLLPYVYANGKAPSTRARLLANLASHLLGKAERLCLTCCEINFRHKHILKKEKEGRKEKRKKKSKPQTNEVLVPRPTGPLKDSPRMLLTKGLHSLAPHMSRNESFMATGLTKKACLPLGKQCCDPCMALGAWASSLWAVKVEFPHVGKRGGQL